MQRTIEVSHDVFAAIWRAQQAGEESEEEILSRILNVPRPKPDQPPAALPGNGEPAGFSEPRFGFKVPAGFRIHRVYLGKRYEAYAENNAWVRVDTEQRFNSLNDLTKSVGPTTENVWKRWFYKQDNGRAAPISRLRDQSTISKRNRRKS